MELIQLSDLLETKVAREQAFELKNYSPWLVAGINTNYASNNHAPFQLPKFAHFDFKIVFPTPSSFDYLFAFCRATGPNGIASQNEANDIVESVRASIPVSSAAAASSTDRKSSILRRQSKPSLLLETLPYVHKIITPPALCKLSKVV
jgi:hypothetical protein